MMNADIINRAIQLATGGISIIPVAPGGKNPAIPWKKYQQTPATTTQILDWYTQHPDWGLGVICGKVSGNLEMLELEGRAQHLEDDICDLAENSSLGDLFSTVAYMGWSEESPSGGVHYFYRTEQPTAGNTQLAKDADAKILAETRGEGGFVVVAPTDGTHHQTGKPWTIRTDMKIPTLTVEDHEALWALFQAQNQHLPADPPQPAQTSSTVVGLRPGDDYETKTSWGEILEPHGWTPVFTTGNTTYWRRPGKNTGVSATTGHATDRDRLYVFTTSTSFQPEVPYTKFGAYALLNHDGDHTEATKQLAKDGYGTGGYQIVQGIPGLDTISVDTTTGEILDNVTPITAAGKQTQLALAPDPTPQDPTSPIQSEDYDALQFADTHQHQIAYCVEWGKWLVWNGHAWKPQHKDAPEIRELVKQHLRTVLPVENKTDWAYKKKALSKNGITNRLAMASSDRRLTPPHDDTGALLLDQHTLELNTPGGIINLTTGQLTPSDPTHWHTKTTTITPQQIPTPRWDKFLTQTFNGDQETIGFFQRLVGYSATGEVRDHILPFLFGPGGNGKSVILDVLIDLLGDYATVAPAKFLMAGSEKHETEIARLNGKRLVICSEINETDRFDEAKMKLLTGGDKLTARYLFQDYFTFTPTHTLWLLGNHQPKVQSGGNSFWRRLLLIGCIHKVPKDQIITNLAELLVEEEGAGILYWICQGAKQYFENGGLNTPKSIIAASKEYEQEEDSLSRFVDQCLIIGGGEYVRVKSSEMMNKYKEWCRQEGENETTSTALGRTLRSTYGLGKTKTHGSIYYTNVALANTDPDDTLDTVFQDLGGGK